MSFVENRGQIAGIRMTHGKKESIWNEKEMENDYESDTVFIKILLSPAG